TPRYATAASLMIASIVARSCSPHSRMLRMRRGCIPGRLRVLDKSATQQCFIEEGAHQPRDLFTLVFEREVPRVEQMQLGARQILQIRPSTVGGEDHVVLAPDDECRRLPLAEELLELRI